MPTKHKALLMNIPSVWYHKYLCGTQTYQIT